jgi:hypothetical protein
MQNLAPEKWNKGAIRARLDSLFPHLDDRDLYMLTTTAYVMYIDGRIDGMESASKIWQDSYKSEKEVSHV